MRYMTLLVFVFAMAIAGCASVPVFHSTSETELNNLSESLTGMRLEDLFRQYPILRFVKSAGIGNGNMCHEFSYVVTEKEDLSQRSIFDNSVYLSERKITFSINIFVNDSGVIYEVLTPVLTDVKLVQTNEAYDKFKSKKVKPARDKTKSLPYP